MLEMVVKDIVCWAEHISLDINTGGDKEGIKLRPVETSHGIDYLFPGYWVWAKLIENLAKIGYDSNSLFAANYDWRLSPVLLESRDHYFTRLRQNIERMVSKQNKKVVVIAHSMGSNVWFYFLKWVESKDALWVDKNIHAFVNIGGALLGSMKGLSTLLSGEMKDTVNMEFPRVYFLDKILAPLKRLEIFRSWTSIANLLPKGGNVVWGHHNYSYEEDSIHSLNFPLTLNSSGINLTIEESLDFLFERLSNGEVNHTNLANNLKNWYSFGSVLQHVKENVSHSRYWTNPLESPLPHAPKMKIFCFYGIDKPTERGFLYKDQIQEGEERAKLRGIRYVIDTNQLNMGIKVGNGDGTVPLISLGYMCAGGWKLPTYNPSGMDVWTREYRHDPDPILLNVRGGDSTGDHVDILGNTELLIDVLSVASGLEAVESNRILSNIQFISKEISHFLVRSAHTKTGVKR
eukprot:TRINITY_DN4740_c0_g1_i4.p1 TRINITY_DN4740_c0_g1~~TRINITY_DN4740_c0_g1_i4.p1  ORF type:complete len:461 (+),score=93.90 TRINITY_DN4740_c0_g1_i4:971-2353(+)